MSDVEQFEVLVLGSGKSGKHLAWHMASAGYRMPRRTARSNATAVLGSVAARLSVHDGACSSSSSRTCAYLELGARPPRVRPQDIADRFNLNTSLTGAESR
jgi:hypothetical protein